MKSGRRISRRRGRLDATAGRYRSAVPIAEITPASVQERLSYRLRLIIGRGRKLTLAEAARATGIGERTLKAYVEGRACPNLARYGRLLRVFGPEVGIELASMIGWEPRAANVHLPRIEDLRALRASVSETIRAIESVLAHDVNPVLPPASGRPLKVDR